MRVSMYKVSYEVRNGSADANLSPDGDGLRCVRIRRLGYVFKAMKTSCGHDETLGSI